MASVPDTNTFSLTDVTAVVGGTNLVDAFTNSVQDYFDLAYGNGKTTPNSMYEFRNYTEGISLTTPTLDSYLELIDSSGTATSISITCPPTANIGDLLFMYIGVGTNTTITNPAGWTVLKKVESSGTYTSLAIYFKIVASGDIGSSTTVNVGAPSQLYATKMVVNGKNTSPFYSVLTSDNYDSASGVTTLSPSITTGITSSLLLGFYSIELSTNQAGTTFGWSVTGVDVNIGNLRLFGCRKTTQPSDGTSPSLTYTTPNSSKIQSVIVQVLPY